MSDTGALHPGALPPSNEPLRIAVRRLRWFREAFERFAEACGREIGCTFRIDDGKLAAIFVRWLAEIDRQKPADKAERRAFFEFASGLMLREMMADMPLSLGAAPTAVGPESVAAFWPEGYCCTMFCLSVHAAAVDQEFHEATTIDPAVDDLRQWWSLRENAAQDRAFPAGFLQMLLGHAPNWTLPDVFRERLARELS